MLLVMLLREGYRSPQQLLLIQRSPVMSMLSVQHTLLWGSHQRG